ncbi:fatty acid desaturase family protein [Actinacidiphila sp. ITFR-21]|uniref:fatty acid desaturase family protein n=1 Tax=Actinacidiphila sp. ITFR-21 TaxID=3075199 RepID=UPI002889C448|nr:acyl-CoA desaturase [Streptomyces sp. ITFR-21]WNI17153.1 acyl-CoA desaturase [Streptomyces sp. ITFR-21]
MTSDSATTHETSPPTTGSLPPSLVAASDGTLAGTPDDAGSDFARLARRVATSGLLKRRPGYYSARIGGIAFLYAGTWAAFAFLGSSWWQLATAGVLGVLFAQIALVAHDIAHRQVFRLRRPSEVAGRIAGNLCVGMSYGWWQDKHTRHHANPNHEALDPDVNPDILLWSTDQARAARGVPRLIGGSQAYLFFPLLTLEGMNLHVAGVRALFRPEFKQRTLEAALLGLHIAGYLTVLFLVLSPLQALAFIAVHQGLFGVYMGCTFAPNHKGMPTLTGDDRPDFLRRQVLTSRNVRGGRFTDLALGGLNYQIEHHLFPSMPTPHLRQARPIVRAYCAELGISYAEAGLFASYAQALRHLHRVGAPLRAAPSA